MRSIVKEDAVIKARTSGLDQNSDDRGDKKYMLARWWWRIPLTPVLGRQR